MKIKIFNKELNFSKAIKGNDPNQISLFGQPIAGMEKEFAPNDKRRLEITNGGKLRWKNADQKEAVSSKPLVISKNNYGQEVEKKYQNAKKNLGIENDLELLAELEKRLRDIPGPNMNRIMYDDKEAEKLTVRNKHEEIIRYIKKKNNIIDSPTRDEKFYQSKTTEWLNARRKQLAGRILNGKATDREVNINSVILEELKRRGKDIPTNHPSGVNLKLKGDNPRKITNNMMDELELNISLEESKLGESIINTLPGFSSERIFKNLGEDEESSIERHYKEYKQLEFYSGKAKIENEKDVAFIFQQLQDESVEHFFACWILEDGTPIVQHVSTGTFDSALVDPKSVFDPVSKLKPKQVYFIHNHPSGNIEASTQDISIHQKLKEMLSDKVEVMGGIIIDGKSCKYGLLFNPTMRITGKFKKEDYKENIPLTAISYSKKVLFSDAEKKKIKQPSDIAEFITASRFTTGERTQVLCLDPQNQVVGRFNINPIKKGAIKKNADEILGLVVSSGAINFILIGNNDPQIISQELESLQNELKISETMLFDYIGVVSENSGKSMSRTNIILKKSRVFNLLKAFGQQINLFGKDQPFSKEGTTKEGKGGTLRLTRDNTGKGAHWRILNKKKIENGKRKPEEGATDKGKIITPAQAYNLLQDKLGNKTFVTDKDGNLLGEGTFQLINENSERNYSLFLREKNGFDLVIPIPKNQAAIQTKNGVQFKFTDRTITISLKEKSKDLSKPIEIEKAEENAKRARELERMRNYNRWQDKAEDFAEIAKGQKNWFFNDLEEVARNLNLEFSNNNKLVKKADTLFREIKRNATKYGNEEIHSALIGAFEVGSIFKMKRVITELKDKGYTINHAPDVGDKENFFIRIKINKGENDPLPKELQFATQELAKAAEECAKKPNALRETETSLMLKMNAEKIPEYLSIKKKLFGQVGEGLGQIWITGGLPGSGKSSVLSGGFQKNKISIDPDEIKYLLAEERGISKEEVDKKPWELHEDSSLLAKHLTREAVREGKDVIYDVTMKGKDNLFDIMELVKNDTFQANAKFIHIPIEKGIERDKARGERGGRSIGAELYKKLFGDYSTHEAFFQLKDEFDNFDVYDNSAPLGEGAKLFYQKIDGREQIHEPEIYNEFQKVGKNKVEKAISLTNPNKQNEEINMNNENGNSFSDSDKIKMLLGFDEEREIDPEQDFFELGMLKMHGLIDENMNLTPEGEQKFEEKFGSKFEPEEGTDFDSILNPKKNIAGEEKQGQVQGHEQDGYKTKSKISVFGKSINISKNALLPSKKNPLVKRWQNTNAEPESGVQKKEENSNFRAVKKDERIVVVKNEEENPKMSEGNTIDDIINKISGSNELTEGQKKKLNSSLEYIRGEKINEGFANMRKKTVLDKLEILKRQGKELNNLIEDIDNNLSNVPVINKEKSKNIVNGSIIIAQLEDGFLATDFDKIYSFSKTEGMTAETENDIWRHNQNWYVREHPGLLKYSYFPKWVDVESVKKIVRELANNSYADLINKYTQSGEEKMFYSTHNRYTGSGWYASHSNEAILEAITRWTPLFDIKTREGKLLYDNGESRFTGKPIQLWDNGDLSTFSSGRQKEWSSDKITNNCITLIKYAIDDPQSIWRKDKKWKELLDFNGEIEKFKSLGPEEFSNFLSRGSEEISIAKAGKYYLVRHEWGGMSGGEGDSGENLWLVDSSKEQLPNEIQKLLNPRKDDNED